MNLWQKISEVMKEVEYLQKDDKVGTGNNSYKAISEEKVTEAVRKSFIKHGLIMIPTEQEHHCESRETVNDFGKAGVSRLSTVAVRYKLIDTETGEFEYIASGGQGVDTQDKAIGKAMTYSYKYALLRSFAIPTGEDPDKVASSEIDSKTTLKPAKTEPPKNTITSAQAQELEKLITDTSTDMDKLLEYYHVQTLNEMTPNVYAQAMSQLKKKHEKPPAK